MHQYAIRKAACCKFLIHSPCHRNHLRCNGKIHIFPGLWQHQRNRGEALTHYAHHSTFLILTPAYTSGGGQ